MYGKLTDAWLGYNLVLHLLYTSYTRLRQFCKKKKNHREITEITNITESSDQLNCNKNKQLVLCVILIIFVTNWLYASYVQQYYV